MWQRIEEKRQSATESVTVHVRLCDRDQLSKVSCHVMSRHVSGRVHSPFSSRSSSKPYELTLHHRLRSCVSISGAPMRPPPPSASTRLPRRTHLHTLTFLTFVPVTQISESVSLLIYPLAPHGTSSSRPDSWSRYSRTSPL